jgi:hypothetical protein
MNNKEENNVLSTHVIASVFNKPGHIGDFEHMIQCDINNNDRDTLYIFNDNEESFSRGSYKQGKGNAVIRKHNIYAMKQKKMRKPYSHGIPTGTLANGGYTELNGHVKYIVDLCIKNIKTIIKQFNIKKIYYSASGPNKGDLLLGQSLFKVDMSVRKYITKQIHELTDNDVIYQCNN